VVLVQEIPRGRRGLIGEEVRGNDEWIHIIKRKLLKENVDDNDDDQAKPRNLN
jgi:hypothetical protein